MSFRIVSKHRDKDCSIVVNAAYAWNVEHDIAKVGKEKHGSNMQRLWRKEISAKQTKEGHMLLSQVFDGEQKVKT